MNITITTNDTKALSILSSALIDYAHDQSMKACEQSNTQDRCFYFKEAAAARLLLAKVSLRWTRELVKAGSDMWSIADEKQKIKEAKVQYKNAKQNWLNSL